MADEVDSANDDLEKEQARVLKSIRLTAEAIPVGEPGECIWCGEFSQRLVNEACAPCRDKRKLP